MTFSETLMFPEKAISCDFYCWNNELFMGIKLTNHFSSKMAQLELQNV